MTHKHNFIRQVYSRGTDDSTKHHLVQCAGCGLSAHDPEHEDLVQQYQAACESIERTRSDPDAVGIMTREGWRLLGQLILKDELRNPAHPDRPGEKNDMRQSTIIETMPTNLKQAAIDMAEVVRRVQDTLAGYIDPGFPMNDPEKCINALLGIVDHKDTLARQRAALAAIGAAHRDEDHERLRATHPKFAVSSVDYHQRCGTAQAMRVLEEIKAQCDEYMLDDDYNDSMNKIKAIVYGERAVSARTVAPPSNEFVARALAAEARAKRLEDALLNFQSYGCPVCNGDCASANPPVMLCPMIEARTALAANPTEGTR